MVRRKNAIVVAPKKYVGIAMAYGKKFVFTFTRTEPLREFDML